MAKKKPINEVPQAPQFAPSAYVPTPVGPRCAFQIMNNSYPMPAAAPANGIYLTPAYFPVDVHARQVDAEPKPEGQPFGPNW